MRALCAMSGAEDPSAEPPTLPAFGRGSSLTRAAVGVQTDEVADQRLCDVRALFDARRFVRVSHAGERNAISRRAAFCRSASTPLTPLPNGATVVVIHGDSETPSF